MRSKHTEEQLAWLKNHLPKYEQKTSGATRGDAKKFALDCAATYIQLWGLPKTGNGDEEKESVVKEQIYTWFKNSCARGKDARMKHQQKKNAQQAHPPPPPHHYPHHHPHPAHAHPGHHGHGHPPQHLPYPGPPLHHQHPPRPPHPSLQHDDLRRRESLTLPPIHSYHPRPPSPGSSNSSARGSPVLRPVYPPPPPPRHPHHLPPTSSLRSTHALSIDTVPAPSAPPQQGQQNLAARLLALAAGAKVVDVAADALATPNPAPRVVDALFTAAASTSNASSSSRAASGSGSGAGAAGMGGATLPTPVSVGGGSPVRSVGMDVDDDADADAEGEPESPSPTDHGNDVPLTVTSPSPSTSLRRSLSNSPSPSRTPAPTLPELLRAFAQLLSALPPADAAAARAALHCALRRPPPLPPASSPSPSTSTMHDFRERAESVRRLRREHVLWARVLSSCLSDCPHLLGPDEELREWRWFVRGCVKDALVSDDEEAGWLAGAYLLRGLRSEEREEGLVRAYESRWRDVRDERRLSEMGDVMVDLRH